MSLVDHVAVIAAAIAFVSAVVSVAAIYVPWVNTHDSKVFGEAVLALERGYSSLMRGSINSKQPPSNRLNWLASARHIESFKDLRNSLKTPLYRRLCEDNEEYWRHEFYLTILDGSIRQKAYFEEGHIEPRSAIVIYAFAARPGEKRDKLDVVDFEKMFQESDLLRGNYGLQQYLSEFQQFGGEA